ncbi:hypothetical protein [Pseudarthrobacter sp. N5]|uniref:hypothetical protein n=1 Tax=Pseudarthrobacter sp. N5 TaxID=3418416 RepID=UPI003CEB6F3D
MLLDDVIGGIETKVGLPDSAEDLRRAAGVRDHIGRDVAMTRNLTTDLAADLRADRGRCAPPWPGCRPRGWWRPRPQP